MHARRAARLTNHEDKSMYFSPDGDVQSVLYVNLVIALCAILFTILADPRRVLDRLAFSAIMLLSLGLYI
ncbi:MAG TPA: hypothetical protein DHE23_14275, partial [Agrobacterium sp.]|nr:hypothetical protein [Agrobacterium sp.]